MIALFKQTSRIKRVIMICIGLFLVPIMCFGKSFHVAINGNDSNAGTIKYPYRTVQKAASVMMPGDTCYIHAGTYYETVRPAN